MDGKICMIVDVSEPIYRKLVGVVSETPEVDFNQYVGRAIAFYIKNGSARDGHEAVVEIEGGLSNAKD